MYFKAWNALFDLKFDAKLRKNIKKALSTKITWKMANFKIGKKWDFNFRYDKTVNFNVWKAPQKLQRVIYRLLEEKDQKLSSKKFSGCGKFLRKFH